MLLLLFSFASSFRQVCVANPTPPEPPGDGYELIHIQVVTRHGARSPLDGYLKQKDRGIWRCDSPDAVSGRVEAVPLVHHRKVRTILDNRFADYPPNCRLGELTIEGMQMHLKLGKAYRKYLVDDLHFLDETYNPDQIYIRSTAYDRTFKSALSFIGGLYESQSVNELIDITSGPSSNDLFRPSHKTCGDIKNLYQKYVDSDKFKEFLARSGEILKPVREYLNLTEWTQSSGNKACDWVFTMYCNEKTMSPDINQTHIDICSEMLARNLYDLYLQDDETMGIGFSAGMRELLRVLNMSLSGESTVKFALHSTHDSTVSVFMSLLGNRLDTLPPLASHLAMEVYQKNNEKYVRFVLNGKPLPIKFMNDQIMVKLDDFITNVKPKINYCKEFP
ncbi:histidine acid phosphatase [Histomonas meleagridis]|uniref:histidine acid phosphatase n=1 Tax=Histomonas meleagridis TaxID=135588 RepID=UPI00355A136B|nr:histidine acid phosphatase [Histomonas meleagridis]KAH0796794.1 histidine acid phosphatase [Histomonas meleagridis]